MSSGVVHQRTSVILAGGYLAGGIVFSDPACIEYAAGALLGMVLSPDLDVDKAFIGDKSIKKRLGYIPYQAWRACWHFYRRSIKHGSELSHFPVISTLGRIAYLFLFIVVFPNAVLSFFGLDFVSETNWWASLLFSRWRTVLGLMSSDFLHWIMDIATAGDKFSLGSLLAGKTIYQGGKHARSYSNRHTSRGTRGPGVARNGK